MSNACCCVPFNSDYEAVISSRRDIRKTRKPHKCCECNRTIPKGAPCRYETALFEDRWEEFRTCALCSAVRDDRLRCGWSWGDLWDELRYCLEDCDCEDDCDCDSLLDPPTHPIEVAS
jgi:hypothetical protein